MLYSDLRTKGKRLPLAEVVPLPAPLTIYLEPTNACNFKCVFCPESLPDYFALAGGKRHLSMPDFEIVERELRAIGGVKLINFHMLGEPLANKLTPEFIRRCRPLAERLILTTNGTLLMEAISEQLLEASLDYIRVSIYGVNQEQFTATTGSKFDYRKPLVNVQSLRDLRSKKGVSKPHIYVKMVNVDAQTAETFHLQWQGIADEVAVEPAMGWNGTADVGQESPGHKRACPMPFYTTTIHADLKVSPCGVDWDQRLLVGDLRTQSLKEIWEGQRLRNLQLLHLSGNRASEPGCANCSYIQTLPDNIDTLTAAAYESRLHKQMCSKT